MIADRAFTDRVMERLEDVDQSRRRPSWLRCLVPLALIIATGGAWAISFFDAAEAIHLSITVIAICNVVGLKEQHLATALLGPFAPLPLLVSLLLLLAAFGWVRTHQPVLSDVEYSRVLDRSLSERRGGSNSQRESSR